MRIHRHLAGVLLALSVLVGACLPGRASGAPAPASVAGTCVDCGSVIGNVSESGTGNVLPGVNVMFFPLDEQQAPIFVTTDALGQYATGASLPPGSYAVRADSDDHIDAMHDGVRCGLLCDIQNATPVTISANSTRVINFRLDVGAAIRGTIHTPGPASGLVLFLQEIASGGSTVLTPAPDGSYDSRAVLPSGAYRMRTVNQIGLVDQVWPGVECAGGACPEQTGDDIVAIEGGTTEGIDFTLVAGARISGHITRAADGSPVADHYAVLARDDNPYTIAIPSGADGGFSLGTGLPPGNWRAFAPPLDGAGLLGEVWQNVPCIDCAASLSFTPIPIVDASAITGIDFALDPPSRITGRITDTRTGDGIDGALVQIISRLAALPVLQVTSASDGSFEAGGLAPGDYFMRASATGYVTGVHGAFGCGAECEPSDGANIPVGIDQTVVGIDLALYSGASIAGVVTGAGGVPRPLQPVVLFSPDFDFLQLVQTDVDGSYQFIGLDAGSYLVLADSSEDYVATLWPDIECLLRCGDGAAPPVTLAADEQRSGIDIAMIRGAFFHGHVTADAGGAALQGVQLIAIEPSTNVFSGSASTGIDGEYRVGPLLPGPYVLRTQNQAGYIDEAYDDHVCTFFCGHIGDPVVLVAGQTVEADFGLSIGGRIAGRITNAVGGAPLADLTASAIVMRADGSVAEAAAVRNGNGEYLTSGLPAGTYFVRSENAAGLIDQLFENGACFWCLPPAATPVDVTLGATTGAIDFALTAGARLRGRLTEQGSGLPIRFTALALHDAQGRFMFRIDGQDGEYESPAGLAPGTYFLRTASFGRYRDELLGGLSCQGVCDVRRGTPIVVGTTDVDGLDFELDAALMVDGFEQSLP